MISNHRYLLFFLGFITIPQIVISQSIAYPWLRKYNSSENILNRISVPNSYQRVQLNEDSFGEWLRHLPLKQGKPPVYLFNNKEKTNQEAHFAVIDIDIGDADLQQCADAVIRLRAEYLYSQKEFDRINFNFTSGDAAKFRKWIEGFRPVVTGNSVQWNHTTTRDSSYVTFRKYLNSVFTYAGSYSLSRECQIIRGSKDLEIGDIFIEGGFPGHAVIIVDIAINKMTGKKLLLLAQSYMPAQDMHVLVNSNNPNLSPWYEFDSQDKLCTPEWTFGKNSTMRFR